MASPSPPPAVLETAFTGAESTDTPPDQNDTEKETLESHEVIELQAFSERKAWIEEKIKVSFYHSSMTSLSSYTIASFSSSYPPSKSSLVLTPSGLRLIPCLVCLPASNSETGWRNMIGSRKKPRYLTPVNSRSSESSQRVYIWLLFSAHLPTHHSCHSTPSVPGGHRSDRAHSYSHLRTRQATPPPPRSIRKP